MFEAPDHSLRLSHPVNWLVFLVLVIALLVPGAASSQSEPAQVRSHLCGRLLFLVDDETGANLLGLKSCSGQEILLFSQRPAQLFNYYEFTTVTVKTGTRVKTDKYGYVNKFISNWVGYVQIANCSQCGTGSFITPTSPLIPTQKPVTTALPLYGRILILTILSEGQSTTQAPIFFPCGSTSPHLMAGLTGTSIAEGYYALYEPAIATSEGQQTAYGPIEKSITGWTRITTIDSCLAVGMSESHLQEAFTIRILKLSWSRPLKEFQPSDLVLDVLVTGPPATGRGYFIEADISEDNPANNLKLIFDSAACFSCTPGELQEGEFPITIKDFRFPASYRGNFNLVLKSSSIPNVSAQITNTLIVAPSEQPNLHCTATFIKGILAQALEDATAAGESTFESQIQASNAIQDIATRLDQCGSEQTCLDDGINQLIGNSSIPGMDKITALNPLERLTLLLVKMGETTDASASCEDWLRYYLSSTLSSSLLAGRLVNGLLAQSPVYPLIVNPAGQRSGYLEDGQVVKEIPGVQVVDIADQRSLLWEGSEPFKMQARGYQPGSLNLTAVVARGAGYGESLYFPGVMVTQGTRLELDLSQPGAMLNVDLDGDGSMDEKITPLERQVIGEASPEAAAPAPAFLGMSPNVIMSLVIVAGVIILLMMTAATFLFIYLRRRKARDENS
jgi:hypothetical protein